MADQTNDLVARLVQMHVAEALRSYQGTLTYASHVVDNDWLPAEDDLAVQTYLGTLREHLAKIGKPEEDSFLLRVGLTAPGLQRGIVPPIMVLEENRGGFSVRRQKEADGLVVRLREVLSLGRRFLPTLSADSRQAIAELGEMCQRQLLPKHVNWVGLFSDVSTADAQQLTERALECLESDEKSVHEIGTEILQHLVCLREPALSETCCGRLVERGVFWPTILYRGSGDKVARQLVARIEADAERLELSHLLLALAWTRSSVAHQAFRRWSSQPPAWTSKLHVPPEDYLHDAGWCLDEDGQRHELISTRCFRLLRADDSTRGRVPCRTRAGKECPSCEGPLSWLFDFSHVGDEYFGGGFADAPRRVMCCLDCACYGPIFTTYTPDGKAEWLAPQEPFETERPGHLESCVRQLGDSPYPPFACSEGVGPEDVSTLGGAPTWRQDAEYPRCVECGRRMTFLAQHDNGIVGEEGIYYAFFCARCRVASVSYQQT